MPKRELECGCEILVYEDGSAPHEIVYCRMHASAEMMQQTLIEITETLEVGSRAHQCAGLHCVTCAPVELVEKANKVLSMTGRGESSGDLHC